MFAFYSSIPAKPTPVHKPKIVEAAHNSITLSWQPPRYNPAHSHGSISAILAYTVEMTKFSTGKSKNNHGGAGNGSGGGKLHPGQWTVLTKACQGTSYNARDLEPDTTYAFRVRAENLYGVGKPSVPSETATTRMFESTGDSLSPLQSSFGNPHISLSPASPQRSHRFDFPSPPSSPCAPSPPSPPLSETGGHRLRRRHSFNVHLDGGAVNKIANHSEVVLTDPDGQGAATTNFKLSQSHSCHAALSPDSSIASSSSSSSSCSSALPPGFSPKHRYSDRRRGGDTASGERSNRLYERSNNPSNPSVSLSSLCKKNSTRGNSSASSGQLAHQGRKISLPILLPGTGTESLSRLRESRTSLRSSVSDVHSGQGHKGSGSHEVMLVTVDRRHGKSQSVASSRRLSSGSAGSGGSSSTNRDRYSRVSIGSGDSELTSSRMSLEDSASSSELSRGMRTSMVSSASSGAIGSGGRCGSYNSISLRSSRSDVTLSNSKDGSKDSLCDLASSSHSSAGDGNGDDLEYSSDSRALDGKLGGLNNNNDDDKLRYLNNNFDGHDENEDFGLKSFLKPGDFEISDDIYKLKEQLKNFEITEENLRFHDLGQNLNCQKSHLNAHHTQNDLKDGGTTENGSYYASLENPWEKDPSASGLSERILAAPFCDDIKMALYARDLPESPRLGIPADNAPPKQQLNNGRVGNGISHTSPVYEEAGDFRTLRSVLQSSNMFVKAQRFSPDVVGVVVGQEGDTCRTLTKSRLTTIQDADEDEDPVRITAL